MRDVTLVFLVKNDQICLAMKKRGFGMDRWNGVGGKLEPGESIEEAARRESKEEIGVDIKEFKKAAELTFYFSNNPSWDQRVHVFICKEWLGAPTESEEMRPKWFSINELPFDKMWADDKFWLPEVIAGKYVTAEFTFGAGDVIEKQKIEVR